MKYGSVLHSPVAFLVLSGNFPALIYPFTINSEEHNAQTFGDKFMSCV